MVFKPGPTDMVSTYLLLWFVQALVPCKRYAKDAAILLGLASSSTKDTPPLSFEVLILPFGLVAAATGSHHIGAVAHATFVAAKLVRQPNQFNSDIWCGAADAVVLLLGALHLARAAPSTARNELVRAFAPAVRRIFGAFYLGAGVWKLNTAHLGTRTSCSVIYLVSMLDAYTPALAARPDVLRLVARVGGAVTCVLETSIGALMLAPSARWQRMGVALGVALHLGICLTPPPNNVGSFSAVAVMRYAAVVPHGAAVVVGWARRHAFVCGALLAAFCAAAHGRAPPAVDDLQTVIFGCVSAVVLGGAAVEAAVEAEANGPRRHQRHAAASPARGVKAAEHVCALLALFYAFALPVLGLQDMGNVHMFANLRLHGGSNHLFLPTGLLQQWAAAREAAAAPDASGRGLAAGPFAGGVVRVDHTSSRWVGGIYPYELTSVLSASARARLAEVHHVGREFLPLVGRIFGPPPDETTCVEADEVKRTCLDANTFKLHDSSNPTVPKEGDLGKEAYTVHALELRRLISEARGREANFTITYARLPPTPDGHIDWASAPSAGERVTLKVARGAADRCTVDASGAPCALDEPALQPWPPEGPPWAVALLLKLLVFYPVPVLGGELEMACCDG